jgi:EmrB/QacA subfamily drug resistance transporter
MLLAALDSSIVNTALPRMVGDLGGLKHLSWVVTAFMLCATITTPLYGKLSDTFGRRMMFAIAIIVFLAGSTLCGAAQSIDQLIAFRALQGLGGGGLLVLAQAAIGVVVAPRDRPRYQGLFTGVFGLANVTGPVLGGVITQLFSWRWIFYVNLPIGVLALALVWRGLPAMGAINTGQARRIDYAGAVLLSGLATTLLLLLAWGGNQFAWISLSSLTMALVTLLFITLFLWRESRAREPLIRLALFRNPVFARGSLAGGMVMFAMLGALVFLPLYFQLVLGMSPAVSGAMILPQVGFMLLSSIIGGRIVTRLGHYRPFLLAGIGLETMSLITLAALAWIAAPPWAFLLMLGALGMGMGMGIPNLTNAIQNAVDHAELGAATGAMVFVRSLGGAVGVAASGAIMASGLATAHLQNFDAKGMKALIGVSPAQHMAIASAYRSSLTGSFAVSGVVMIVAFVILVGLPEVQLRKNIRGA